MVKNKQQQKTHIGLFSFIKKHEHFHEHFFQMVLKIYVIDFFFFCFFVCCRNATQRDNRLIDKS